MDLVLHAGMHKTGTSSFQKLLRDWEAPPNSEAWVLPSQLNAKNAKKFDPNWISEKLRSNLRHVIVSHEGLSTFSTAHWLSLREAIPSHIEPRIIIVFRPWQEYLISRWSTCCLRRDSNSFHRYIETLLESQTERVELDHSLCIKRPILAGMRKIECIDYEANIKKEKSILPILCRRAGIPAVNISINRNKRPEIDTIEMLRIINGATSEIEQRAQNDLCVSIGEHRPVDRFYDQLKLVEILGKRNKVLFSSIREKLMDSKSPIKNQKLNEVIIEKKIDLHQAMSPWIVGERTANDDNISSSPNGLFSKLEYQDLEENIKKQIKNKIRTAIYKQRVST